jgi:hypothetical protein
MTKRLACAAFLGALAVAAPSAGAKPPRVLATGDSMVEAVATSLERSLERRGQARVIVDAQPASGISKPWRRDWLDYAPFQVRRHRPRATVMLIGANEGYPMVDARGREVLCCRRAWIEAYADAVADMIRSYTAGGRHVYWLTLPGPRDRDLRRLFAAVNAALVRAVRRGDRAHLIDLVGRFTPGYRYRRAIPVDGRRRVVRAPDGIHLNARGGAVAARMVRRALAADGVIR